MEDELVFYKKVKKFSKMSQLILQFMNIKNKNSLIKVFKFYKLFFSLFIDSCVDFYYQKKINFFLKYVCFCKIFEV